MSALGHFGDKIVGGGVVEVHPVGGLRVDEFAIDEELCRGSDVRVVSLQESDERGLEIILFKKIITKNYNQRDVA